MIQIDLNKLSEEEILKLINDELSEDELMDAEDYQLCDETISVNFSKCSCSNLRCSDCLFGKEKRSYVLEKLNIQKPLDLMEDKPSDAIELMVIRRIHHGLDSTINVDWPIGHRTWARSFYKEEFTKNKTIHPEDNKYTMNAPATCFAPINYSSFEGPFKVGDWVEITKSDFNWNISMNNFVGKKVQITEVFNNGWSIQFKECGGFSWNYDQGHFIPCDPPEGLLNSVTKKYTIEELETNSKLVLYIDNPWDFAKIKRYTERLNFNYYGQYCYSLYGRTYSSNSSRTCLGSYSDSADTIITIDDLIFPEIKKEENKFSYRLSELEEREDLVVFLETEEEYNQLKQYTKKLVSNYYGDHCYSLYSQTYSSDSTKISPGSYKNAQIILFKNVTLPISPLSDKTVCVEPILTKKSTFGQEEIYIIPLPE